MCDSRKTKKTLLEELKTLRSRAAELERIEAEHKKVEQKLKQYQFMVESAHDVIFFKDLKSRYVIANDKTLEAFGLSREQVIGKNDYEIMPEKAEAGKNIEDDKLVFETGKPKEITKHMTGSDGKERWFQAIKVPQFDNNGNIIGLVGIARDITTLKHAEETLRESEEKYKTLCHNIPGMVYMGELDWSTKVICNSEDICGYSTEEFNFQKANWLDIIHPDDKEKAIKEALGLEKKRTDIVQEYRIIDKSGSIRWVEDHKTSLFTKEGIYKGVDGIAFDITERKKAEEEIKRAAEEWGRTFNAIADLVFIVDKDFTITKMNKAFPEALKLKPEDIIGRKCYELLHKSDKPWPGCPFEKAKKDKEPCTQEVYDPNIGIPLLIRTSPIFDDNGKLVGAVHIAKDITDHKNTEQSLRESEERLRVALSASQMGTWRWDPATNQDTRDASFNGILGLEAVESTQPVEDFLQRVHPEDRDMVDGEIQRTLREHCTYVAEFRIVRPDGTVRWLRDQGKPLYDEDDHILYLTGAVIDITERKRAEEELLFKSTLLEAQSETSIDGILVVDGEGKSISFNNNFGRMWNIPQQILDTRDDEKMLQYVLSQLKTPEQFLERVKYLYAHKNEKSRDEIQFKDGRVFDRYSSPLLDSNDKYCGRVWYFRDITEHKRADEALRESEEKFRTFMETASDLMHITDKDGNLTYVNDAMAGTLGYSKDEMIGMHLTEVLSKEEAKRDFDRKLQELVTTGEIDIESVWLTKDGKEIYGQTKVVAVYDRDGNFAGGREILRDITERKRAEEELQQARDELEIRVEQRTADLARVNEQLRSLASELSLAEERMRRRIAMDVHDHVGQNLAISKIKIESLRESATSPELAEDLEEIRDLISQTIESTRSLTFELSPPVLYELGFEAAVEWLVRQTRQQYGLSADFKADGQTKPLDNNVRVLLFQAVRELLVNVAKHAQAHNVTVSTRGVGNEIRVSVEDDGVGFGVSKAGSHDYKTGGFGLFSIRERLGHIGGRLEVESKPGLGTRVTLTAPIDQESQNDRRTAPLRNWPVQSALLSPAKPI